MLFSTSAAGYPLANRLPPPDLSVSPSVQGGNATDPIAQTQPMDELRNFGLVSNQDGWILVGRHLYWKTSSGTNWNEITPALPTTATIYTVNFADEELGWVLWSDFGTDGSLVLQIERTEDGGRSWTNVLIRALTPGDPVAEIENASIDWVDASTGWVSVKQKTGSNFSSGILFHTADGGETWTRLPLPIGEAVHFVNRQVGWVAGGPAGDQLFKTQDGGNTWKKQSISNSTIAGQISSLYPPVFDDPENGLLAVLVLKGEEFELGFYLTGDGGQSWELVSSVPLDSQVGQPALSLLDSSNMTLAIPNSDRIIQMVNGEQKKVINQDGMSAAIVDLKMLDFNLGWAKWKTANCTKQAAGEGSTTIACTSTIKLIETGDGGITWESRELPGNFSDTLKQNYQEFSTKQTKADAVYLGKTLQVEGQGFDRCEIPTLSHLQTWWNNGPYKSVNLYIGGVARACPNSALTAEYVSQMRAQGWSFIPTWVGPQAPCWDYDYPSPKTFSYDVNNAFVQGKDEAYKATARLAELGLTNNGMTDMSGSVVYYDMEGYGTDPACREAAKAFMNGWVTHMYDFGNLAGVYGSTLCNTGLSDFLTIPNIPDAIWPARWYHSAGVGTYDPDASVWDIGICVPSTAWANHQRIRQYAGDHYEIWGGVTITSIDSNVLDGVVAVPYFGMPSAIFTASPVSGNPALTVTFTITNTAFMSSCAWDYGDGQTGNSCAYTHKHIYNNPGKYSVSLTVSSPWGGDSLTLSDYITVNPGALDHFAISAIPSPQTAGTAITGITLMAKDINNNTLTSFTGEVTFSGTAGVTGTSAAFTAGQLTGVSVTPTVAGNGMTFIVTRAGTGKTGTSTFNVIPGALHHFVISAIPSPQTAGKAITGVTLTAKDLNNNTVTSFNGNVTYSGTAGVTGSSPAFTAGQLTGVNVTPRVPGSGMTFVVTSSGRSGSVTFDVNPYKFFLPVMIR
jgi:PKD repeat protein/photosystem II stability/assembly factor-like uncharacterized protein